MKESSFFEVFLLMFPEECVRELFAVGGDCFVFCSVAWTGLKLSSVTGELKELSFVFVNGVG